MAAPLVIANAIQIGSTIFRNVHSIDEGSLGDPLPTRLQTWKDQFFPIFDIKVPAEKEVLIWVVPTIALANTMIADNNANYMDPIVNLILNQNSPLQLILPGGGIPPAIDAAVVVAFNNAWT